MRVRVKGGQCFDRPFRSKTLAKKWKRDMESAIEQDRYEFTNPATKHTLADLVDLYIERVLPGKPRNAKNVLQHLTWWKEELGHLLLAHVRPSVIAGKRDELLAGFIRGGKLCSPTTVVRYLSRLSHVFSKAVKEWEWMRENPIFKIEKPKQAQGRKRVLTEEEQQRLLQACLESGSKDLILDCSSRAGNGNAQRGNHGAAMDQHSIERVDGNNSTRENKEWSLKISFDYWLVVSAFTTAI